MSRFRTNTLATQFAVLSLLLAVSVSCYGKGKATAKFPNVNIKNFGQMDDRFYRGAQPKEEADYKALAELGIKTVIDLTEDPKEYEKPAVEALGMRYVNIPMIAKKYPSADQVAAFLKVVDDPETGKFYLHCAGGRHRTGVLGAVYRFKYDGWDFTRAYAEMKDFDFYTRWGHGDMKKFVEDYWEQHQAQAQKALQGTSASPVAAPTN